MAEKSYSVDMFERSLSQLSVSLNEEQIQKFFHYYEQMIAWNQVMNLTAITEYEEVLSRHFLDSLASVKVCDYSKVQTVIDVGTGAGFPGIPLKIAFPHLKMTLLDSLKKRLLFLDEVIRQNQLSDVKTIHGRAEDYARQKEYRETYDVCVSRAVANLSTLTEYCLPFVRVGGKMIAYKSGKIEEEIKVAERAVELLGGKIQNILKFQLGDADLGRSFVVIEKVRSTPKKYPRKAGTPSKDPIL